MSDAVQRSIQTWNQINDQLQWWKRKKSDPWIVSQRESSKRLLPSVQAPDIKHEFRIKTRAELRNVPGTEANPLSVLGAEVRRVMNSRSRCSVSPSCCGSSTCAKSNEEDDEGDDGLK
ncbi:hypothetical protein Q7C36_005428 [Tachysurus vachellii]|uniref:Uncharacterized protein n=1 Tax=Tachysurus vachellii TaxID=175792 RepID=A0AA88NFE2_TACVA|nr:hypothetical protein Q7C36_005428 [Tachysurus vachellii]